MINKINLRKPFIIGEIGINHNGSIKLAKKLIDLAKESGFDAVKFQKRNPDISTPVTSIFNPPVITPVALSSNPPLLTKKFPELGLRLDNISL